MAFVSPQGYQPAYNPAIPYRSPIYGGLRPGMSVYIQGSVPQRVNRFCVNFSCGQYDGTDIAFHFNPRFDGKNNVVFNTFQSGSWGNEEKRKDGFPFNKGVHFELVFMVNPGGYQVNVNGSHFYEYRHRIPLQRVECIHVDGDVNINSVTVVGGGGGGGPMMAPSFGAGGAMPLPGYPNMNLPVMGGPVYNPPVPYFGNIPGGVTPKRTFVVRGFIPQGGQRFHINFKTQSGDIALHFNVRINENAVVRNSKLRGSWGSEERGMKFNPFVPGQYFDISIRTGNGRYKVFVNGQDFCQYAHRFQGMQMITQLEIGGDVVLSLVQI
ncbi:galectin-4-like [Mixophyes fleayi]|uniref:galectin-4-like n=1 Tax=Mixophyes fleayi TaxID=3061075 RepID=UPI003F4DAFB9